MLFQPEIVRDFAPSDLVGNNAAILADILTRQYRGSVSIDAAGIVASGTPANDTLSITVGTQTAVLTFVNGGGTSRTGALAANVDTVGGAGADPVLLLATIAYAFDLLVKAGDFSVPCSLNGKAPLGVIPTNALDGGTGPASDVLFGGGQGLAVWAEAAVSFAIGSGVTGLSIDA